MWKQRLQEWRSEQEFESYNAADFKDEEIYNEPTNTGSLEMAETTRKWIISWSSRGGTLANNLILDSKIYFQPLS